MPIIILMTIDAMFLVVAVLLVWQVLLLIPMVPGMLIDTRDFSDLPRWQFNGFNILLTSLGLSTFIAAGYALAEKQLAFWAALFIGTIFLVLTALDLFKVFPNVKDKPPVQLLVLEAIGFASAGVLATVAFYSIRLI